jgi:hypothetical protein
MASYSRPVYRQEGIPFEETFSWLSSAPVTIPMPDYPVTPFENFKLAVEHKTPYWMPNSSVDFVALQSQALAGTAMRHPPWCSKEKEIFTDEWGCIWEYVPEAGGAITQPGSKPVLTDITQWEKQVKFPDYASMDFKTRADSFHKNFNTNKVLNINLRQGCTERLVSLTGGYGEAMTMMAEEPEACRDYYLAFGEWYRGFVDHILKFYPETALFSYQDDWGTERDTFFSEAMMEEQVLEPTRKLVEHVHNKGIYFMLHSCGCVGRFLKYMIDMKVDLLQLQRRANDMPAMKAEFGDKIGFNVMLEGYSYAPTATVEEFEAAIRQTVDRYGRRGGVYMTVGGGPDERSWRGIFELYCYSREYYDREREGS